LSLKTKVKSGLRGSRVMSGDWRRLHQVRGVCAGSPENHQVTRLSHKAEAEDRAWLSGQTSLTGLGNRSDWFGVTGRRKLRSGGHASGSQGLRRGYAKCGHRASVRWCYEDNFPKCPWGACRMDLPGPTTSVGTRTDYSVGPWDYPACAIRYLKAWSTRTT
jgi:hypothetical protein